MTGHAVSGVAGPDVPLWIPLAHDRQHQMQHALHGKSASQSCGEREAPTGNRPDRDELRPRQQRHEPPRHRPVGDSDMPQGGKHTAGQGERPSPDTDQGTTRLRPTGVAVEDCRGLALNVRPSFRSGRPPSAACHASAPLKEIRKRHRLRSPARAVAQGSAERGPVTDERHGRCGTGSSGAGGSRHWVGRTRVAHSPPRRSRATPQRSSPKPAGTTTSTPSTPCSASPLSPLRTDRGPHFRSGGHDHAGWRTGHRDLGLGELLIDGVDPFSPGRQWSV